MQEFFLNGKPVNSPEGAPISDTTLARFCENTDFLSPMRLFRSFEEEDHVATLKQVLNQYDNHADLRAVLVKEAKARVSVLMEANSCPHCSEANFWECPVIDDTGASYGLSPFRADFIDYEEVNISVQDIAHMNEVVGIGTVL